MRKKYALDFETHLISPERIAPKPVCLAVANGSEQKVLVGEDMKAFLLEAFSRGDSMIFHSAEFDLSVMAVEWPEMVPLIFDALDACRIHCTVLRHKLYDLSTQGFMRRGAYSLAALSKKYLKFDFGRLKGGGEVEERRWERIEAGSEKEALSIIKEELGRDFLSWRFCLIYEIGHAYNKEIFFYGYHGEKMPDAWRMRYAELDGVPLNEWPQEAIDYPKKDVEMTLKLYHVQENLRNELGYGSINTEALQVASGFVLKMSTLDGIHVDQEKVDSLADPEIEQYSKSLNFLVEQGYANLDEKTGKIVKSMIKLQGYFEKKYGDIMSRTATDKLKLGLADLKKLDVEDEIVDNLIALAECHKNCTTYWPQLRHEKVHPVYDTLKETGRTSSRVDKLFPSLNIQNQPRKEGVRECFIPGEGNIFIACDYSNLELCSAAQTCYDLFGESKLRDDINAGYDIHSLTGSKILGVQYEEFLRMLERGEETAEHYRTLAKPINLGIPGRMGTKRIVATAKEIYGVEMTLSEAMEYRKIFLKAYPEISKYFKHIQAVFGYKGPFSYSTNTRFRNNCTYTTCSNGELLQSLSADGAKNALYKVGRACYDNQLKSSLYGAKFSWFIHDEIGIETKGQGDEGEELARLMIEGMREVLPDVRVTCEVMYMDRWSKKNFIKKEKYNMEDFERGKDLITSEELKEELGI